MFHDQRFGANAGPSTGRQGSNSCSNGGNRAEVQSRYSSLAEAGRADTSAPIRYRLQFGEASVGEYVLARMIRSSRKGFLKMPSTLITTSATWYINNAAGNDNADGSTQALAFATLATEFGRVIKTCDFAAQPTFRLREVTPCPMPIQS